MLTHCLRIFLLLTFCVGAQAQTVQQSGTVTPGHIPVWAANGVLKDGGSAGSGAATSIGVTNNGGPGICVNSGPITGPYNSACLTSSQTGGGSFSVDNYNGATGGFSFRLNGVTQGFPTLSLPTTADAPACFADTTGTLKNCSYPFLANPTATIGLTAVNGTSGAAMRSDGAPALSQSIVPTWSGLHTFSLNPVIGGTATAGLPLLSGGASPTTWGSRSGNTTTYLTLSGSVSVGQCTQFDANGNIVAVTCPGAAARQTVGNTTVTMACGTNYYTSATLTAARVWTLPASSSCSSGADILVSDEYGAIGLTTPIVIAAAGSDTINTSGATKIVLAQKKGSVRLVATGASPGIWTAEYSDRSNVTMSRDVGAYGDGTADDTAALQALLNICQAEIKLSGGIYNTSSPLTLACNNMTVRGAAAGTRITSTVAAGDILDIGDGITAVYNLHLEGLTFSASTSKASGTYAINAKLLYYSTLDNIHVGAFEDATKVNLYNGLRLDGHAVVDITRSYFIGGQNDGIQINGVSPAIIGFSCDAMTFISGWDRYGILVGGNTGGINIDCQVQDSGSHGILIDTSLAGGVSNREVFILGNAAIDSNGGVGVYFGDNSTFLFSCIGCWIGGNVGTGVYISPTQIYTASGPLNAAPYNAMFSFGGACSIWANGNPNLGTSIGHGILDDGSPVSITVDGCKILLNGMSTAGGNGIWLKNKPSYATSVITSNTIQANGNTAGTGYGLAIDSTHNVNVASNIFSGNKQGCALFANVLSDTFIITNNTGCTSGETFSGLNRPAQITSDQNNYSIDSIYATVGGFKANIYLTENTAHSITGIANGWEGRQLSITNIGGFSLTFVNESASSTAANRFTFGTDIVLASGQTLQLKYDGTAARWRLSSGVASIICGGGLSGGTVTAYGTCATLNVTNLAARAGGFDVWQRGAGNSASIAVAASSTSTAGCATSVNCVNDGWYLYTNANQASTVSAQAGIAAGSFKSARVQRDSGQTGTAVMRYGFTMTQSEVVAMAGRYIVVSFTAKSEANWSPTSGTLSYTLFCGTGSTPTKRGASAYTGETTPIASSVALTSTATRYSTPVGGPPANCAQAEFQFFWTPVGTAGTTDAFDVDDLQLEIVPAATSSASPYVAETFDSQLRRSLQLYQKSANYSTAPFVAGTIGSLPYVPNASIASGVVYASIPLQAPMLSIPTVTTYPYTTASNTVRTSDATGVDYPANSGIIVGTTEKYFTVQNSAVSALTIVNSVFILNWVAEAGI